MADPRTRQRNWADQKSSGREHSAPYWPFQTQSPGPRATQLQAGSLSRHRTPGVTGACQVAVRKGPRWVACGEVVPGLAAQGQVGICRLCGRPEEPGIGSAFRGRG